MKNFRFNTDTNAVEILTQITSLLTSREQIDRVQKFAEENELVENIKDALKGARSNLAWADENLPVIKNTIQQMKWNKAGTIQASILFSIGVALLPLLGTLFYAK